MLDYLNNLGATIVASVQNSLDEKGLTNTGETKNSLRYEVTETQELIKLDVYGGGQLLALESGASPLKNKTGGFIEAITEWAKSKLGLDDKEAKSLAFAYMKKRVGSGRLGVTTLPDGSYYVPNKYNVGNVLSDTINQELIIEIMQELKLKVSLTINEKIKS